MRVLLVAVFAICTTGNSNGSRVKRRLDEFGDMVKLTTDRNPFDFNDYGNYCGMGGEGVPVDAIDKCCQIHDQCYFELNRKQCKNVLKFKAYFTSYKWKSNSGIIQCEDTDVCPRSLCECDRGAAICFGENNAKYSKDNKHGSAVSGLTKFLRGFYNR